jgi:glycosyltransferase involved in cell wall biosynthesis
MGVERIVLALRAFPAPYWYDARHAELYREAYLSLCANPSVVLLNNSAASIKAYESWLGLRSGKIKLVRNGFMPGSLNIRPRDQATTWRAQLGLPIEAPVVGAVTRFAPEKDVDLWLETAAVIRKSRPEIRFVLAGYGHDDSAAQIRDKAARLGLASCFIMPGMVTDPGLVYAALDVMLLTSRHENIPNVMIEAQAAGLPVVGPDVGGIAEAMLNGSTGLLVQNRSPVSLAAATLWVLDNPGWRKQSAIDAPSFVAQRFGQERMTRETMALYG